MRRIFAAAALALAAGCFTGPDNNPPPCAPYCGGGGHPDGGFHHPLVDAGLDAGPVDGGPGDAGLDAGSDGGSDGGLCPPGSVIFPSPSIPQFLGPATVLDVCATEASGGNVPLAGVQVTTVPAWGSTTTAADGTYAICLPPGTPTTLQFSLPGYVPTLGPQLLVDQFTPTQGAEGQTYLLCQSAIQGYEQDAPSFDPTRGTVFSKVYTVGNGPPCGTFLDDAGVPSTAGWTFSATADGGQSWAAAYLDDSYVLEASSATFDDGIAIIYGIDPSVGFVTVSAVKPGADCPQLAVSSQDAGLGLAAGFTGLLEVRPGFFSLYPYVVGSPLP